MQIVKPNTMQMETTHKNKVSKSLLMKWAWKLYRKQKGNTDKQFADCLSYAWKVIKDYSENDGFNALYKRHYAGLLNYIKTMKVANPMDAEELTHDAFIKINENYILFDAKIGNVGSWLYGIANKSVIDFYRRNDKYSANVSMSEYTDENGKETLQIADSVATDELAENNEKMTAILKAMDTLNETQKKVAELHLLKEYTYEEVCNELGLSMPNVKSIIRRMKVALQNELEKVRVMY